MDENLAALLCDPETKAPLTLTADGLLNQQTGRLYPLRDGIVLLQGQITGQNQKYQAMYDKLSLGYDLAERVYYWFTRKPSYRLEYIGELEASAGARVLEVSVGTGANLAFLPQGIEFFGLDLSWGMLRKCLPKIKRDRPSAQLFQAEAEHLPFRDEIFDCVYHVGGINFFNDKAQAIREMIRVAKPGTRIVIVDETEKVVREDYRRNPATRAYFDKASEAVSCPIELVPPEMEEIRAREIVEGKLYCLSFRKPAVAGL